MDSTLELLSAAHLTSLTPSDWTGVCASLRARGEGLAPDAAALDALEALFARVAWEAPLHAELRELQRDPPALRLDLDPSGGLQVLHAGDDGDGWWYAGKLALASFANAARVAAYTLDPGPFAARGLACLELAGDVELGGLEPIRWLRVVERVEDPNRELSLEQARALHPDEPDLLDLSGELGMMLETEGLALALLLLLTLRRARPLRLIAAPDAEAEVDAALAREGEQTELEPAQILAELEGRLYLPWTHDYAREPRVLLREDGSLGLVRAIEAVAGDTPPDPHTDRCLAAELDVTPGTLVGFDRGPADLDELRPRLERAIVEHGWAHDTDPERERPTALRVLLPMTPPRTLALIRRLRAAVPIAAVETVRGAARRFDDFALAARFTALSRERQLQALLGLGQLLRPDDPDWRAALATMSRCIAEDRDPAPLSLAVEALYEAQRNDPAYLLMYLGDQVTAGLGLPAFSSRWSQDSLCVQGVTSVLAMQDPDTIDALLGEAG